MADNRNNKKLPIHLQSAQRRLIVKGGRVVNADQIFNADIYVEDGIIKQVGHNLITPGGARVIDATGKYVIPGGVDAHTYLSAADNGTAFYKGTYAAVVGGTTTVIDTVLPSSDVKLSDGFRRHRQEAESTACCDFGLHVALPRWSEKVREEVGRLAAELAVGSFVLEMGEGGGWRVSDDALEDVLAECRKLGAIAVVHTDESHPADEIADRLSGSGTDDSSLAQSALSTAAPSAALTQRACAAAARTGCPLFVTQVALSAAADGVGAARRDGSLVQGGATAAVLGADGAVQWYRTADGGGGAVCHAVSDPELATHLANLLVACDLTCTSTDRHGFYEQPGCDGQRRINSPQDRLALLWEKAVLAGLMDPRQFVAATSTGAAKLFNLYPRKGVIAVGSDADIVVWDGDAARVIPASSHDPDAGNMFEGLRCQGVPQYVICGGSVCVDQGQLRVAKGAGRFLQTAPFAPETYLRVALRDKAAGGPRAPVRELAAPRPALRNTNGHQVDGPSSEGRRGSAASNASSSVASNGFHSRSRPAEGVRNQQDSNFNASGEQVGDKLPKRTGIKVHAPPGGRTCGGFW